MQSNLNYHIFNYSIFIFLCIIPVRYQYVFVYVHVIKDAADIKSELAAMKYLDSDIDHFF